MALTWLFDLDNTLHPASSRVFPYINQQMTAFIMAELGMDEAEAHRLRQHYWQRYGATLHGLQRHHAVAPKHFLTRTHPLSALLPLLEKPAGVGQLLRCLPGRKVIFSNGPKHYVEAVTKKLGLHPHLLARFGVECLRLRPKPKQEAYLTVLHRLGVRAVDCVMVEDTVENLRPAKQMGMTTVWLHKQPRRPPYVDYRITALPQLARLSLCIAKQTMIVV